MTQKKSNFNSCNIFCNLSFQVPFAQPMNILRKCLWSYTKFMEMTLLTLVAVVAQLKQEFTTIKYPFKPITDNLLFLNQQKRLHKRMFKKQGSI